MFPNNDKEVKTKRDLDRIVTANNLHPHNKKRLDHIGNEFMFDVQKSWEKSKVEECQREFKAEEEKRKQNKEMEKF